MSDGLDAARALLPGVRLDRVKELRAGERSSVDRVRADYPDGPRASLIVKQYRDAGEGWVRETAAFAVVPAAVRIPRLVASGSTPPVMITEDLGPAPSVADALLDDDAAAARAAVVAWAEAIAELHVATRTARPAFHEAIAQRRGDLPVPDSAMPLGIDDAVRVLDRECAALGVRVPGGAMDQLRSLAERLGGSGAAAITPADACPDNNVRLGDRVVLIDFEGAQWRHVAWDVAYLTVPWPSCWCSWRMPDDVAAEAFAAYRRIAAPAFPEVARADFDRDVQAAAVGWAFLSTSWFIDNALGSDPPLNPERPTPTRRAMILHRLGGAARSTELPALAELATLLAGALREQWGEVPLAFAPAFRGAQ